MQTRVYKVLLFALGLALLSWPSPSQTTQALITGQVLDSQDGAPLAKSLVEYSGRLDGQRGSTHTSAGGFFVLPLLSPGVYTLRVTAAGYQPQELHELELPVAAFLGLSFRLRPSGDVWEQGQYRSVFPQGSRAVLTFYGPDLDSSRTAAQMAPNIAPVGLEASVSHVVGPDQMRETPLAGRDAYTLLVTLPAVTTDAATARGLGLSVSGQRPSASNFLLDGVENNNYVTSGPLTPVAPEALQEYRVSLNNFSAEYGRTGGFIANAVTRAGGLRWHGCLYLDGKNEALNANGFQQNRRGLRRAPLKEWQPGFSVAGPLAAHSLFVSAALEFFRTRSTQDPVGIPLPSSAYRLYTAENSLARRLLDRFSAPLPEAGLLPEATVELAPPASLDRILSLVRLDQHLRGGADRLMGRVLVAHVRRPDFIWSPYPDFSTPLRQTTLGLALAAIIAPRPHLTQETRLSVSDDNLGWDRAHPEIPTLAATSGTWLPGSPAFYAYHNRTRTWDLLDNLLWTHEEHIWKVGGGLLWRRMAGQLTAGRDGRYLFPDFLNFALDWPTSFETAVTRGSLPAPSIPDYARQYENRQFFLFAQDDWKLWPRTVLNLGVRYENFGAPRNVGGNGETLLALGSGETLPARLASVQWMSGVRGDLYSRDNNNLAVRFGISHSPGDGQIVLRAGYGIFYDRPFDNLWQNLRSNSITLLTAPVSGFPTNYLEPISAALARYGKAAVDTGFPEPTLYQPGLRDGYVQSYFTGLQRRFAEKLEVEWNAQGSLGRKLITTDQVNRPGQPFNPSLPTLSYRANQGVSDYHGMTVNMRYRSQHLQWQLAYTWSHSIDNQSDPLAGDFFDLTFTRVNYQQDRSGIAAFSSQFDSRADRASSDFDQRHNLVGILSWDVPAVQAVPLLRGWRMGAVAAMRSGFPFTVLASAANPGPGEWIYNSRADLADPRTSSIDESAAGGRKLLDEAAFRPPAPGRQGNLGRNPLAGPGLVNVDLSASRSVRLPGRNEARRLTFRADVFNVLNHANLNNPDAVLGSPTFGVAAYGREGQRAGFPALIPFNETPRQVQVLFRVEF